MCSIVCFFFIVFLIDFIVLDVNDLHKFVTVALHTAAGEGDFANDNLSMLKIVGSGYGPLIYNLQDNPNFDNFKACCQQVWEALEQNSNLPQFLVRSYACTSHENTCSVCYTT